MRILDMSSVGHSSSGLFSRVYEEAHAAYDEAHGPSPRKERNQTGDRTMQLWNASKMMQADETIVPVQMRETRGRSPGVFMAIRPTVRRSVHLPALNVSALNLGLLHIHMGAGVPKKHRSP
jgi:hypothetical protein